MSVRKNPIAYLALFVALGGTAYAAAALPRNSVGTSQLREGAVTAGKLHRHAVSAAALGPNSIRTNSLADGAVTAAKIKPQSLTSSVFAPGAVPPAVQLRTDVVEGATGPASTPPAVGDTKTVDASCLSGQAAVGGGFEVPGDAQSAVEVTASKPLVPPGSDAASVWTVTYRILQAGAPLDVIPYAICASIS